ncbi:AAA family ATPase [Paraburkholderia bryophila]|uniref:ATP-binding protein n=1 Tax=Burkholderiaceae TaxID=119060 RepID=UPI0012E07F3A|nr:MULTISPECIES: AAA family ATPase [Burkholderiaceae]
MIAFATFRLDSENRCVWRFSDDGPDCRLPLTPRAFDMLQYLADRPGRLVTHDELLDALWQGRAVQPEVLKTHVLSIRTTLGDDPRSPRFIETHRGRGYRFIAPLRATPARGALPATPGAQNTFVGRTSQLERLTGVLDEVRQGATRIVFVSGEQGIGKTELVTRFLNTLADDTTVLTSIGRCIEGYGGMENYYPVLGALTKLVRGPAGPLVAQTLAAVAPTWAFHMAGALPREYQRDPTYQTGAGASARMLREICGFLDELTRQRPLVLVLEDLHQSDYLSVDMLSALARQRGESPLMVVATYCAEEAAMLRHPLPVLNMELRLKGLCHDIVLEPLSETAVADYLSVGGQAPDGATAQDVATLLRDRTGGNPLFLAATLDQLAALGMARLAPDGWRFDSLPHNALLAVPTALGQVIEHRIRRLSAVQQHILEIASVAGQTFSAASVAAAADMSHTEVEHVCEVLCAQESFIRRDAHSSSAHHLDSGSYRFRHVMYRQALYERLGLLRVASLQTRMTETPEAPIPIDEFSEIDPKPGLRIEAAHWLNRDLH